MAEFNVTPQAQPPVNYTGASQGIQASPNTALGTLFSGLAESLDMGVKEADRHTQEVIREDIFAEADKIQAEFGVDDATTFQEDAEAPTPRPTQLASAGENLDRLQTAYERGALKESHYWARMNSMVRQLRQRYPGYRGEIDEMVSGIVGGRPANQLRNALFNEWAADTAENPLVKLEDWAVKNGRLPADYYDRSASQNPYTTTELSAYIATKTRQDAEITDTRAQLALAQDKGNVNTQNVEKAFRSESSQFVSTIISDTSSAVGQSFAQLQTRIREAQNAATRGEAQDVTQLLQGAQQLEADVMLALNQKFNETWDGDSNHSYVAQLSKEQKDAAIAQAMVPITLIKDALSTENPFGLMGAVAAENKARGEAIDRELIDSVPGVEELSALSARVGPQMAGLLLESTGAEGQTAIMKSIFNWSAARMANRTPQGTTASVADAFAKVTEAGGTQSDYNGLITQWQKMADQVTKGELPLEMVQSSVQYMFGPESQNILASMNDSSKFEYYRKVSSPQVTKQMIALKDAGDIDSWNTYQQWTTNAFMALFQQSTQALNAINTDSMRAGMSVRWDDASKGFIIKNDGVFGVGAYEAPARELNTAIRTIAPIIEENGGDVSKELYVLMTQMGFDPGATRDKGLMDYMLESLMNGFGVNRSVISPGDPNYPGLPGGR